MTAMPLALVTSLESVGLPKKVRDEINLLSCLLKEVLSAPHGQKAQAHEAAARQMRCAGYKMSAEGIRKLVPAFQREGWQALIDRRKVPHSDHHVPKAFVLEVRRRIQRHGRASFSTIYDELIREWKAGKPLPGYPIHPKAAPYNDNPEGWSMKNLQRLAKSSAFELAAMRVGLGYAKAKHAPKHFRTRRDLHHLSHVMFDDVDHDNFVYVGTKSQSCRVSQLGALDVFSGNYFCYGLHPQLKRWDAKQDKFVTDKLKESNMLFLLAYKLYTHGYSPLGTEYVVERATATIRDATARILHDHTKAIHGEALIRVNLGGWTGKDQLAAGMFLGSGGGNPRHKANQESWHNLLHNVMGTMPGQTGPDVKRRPEQLAGLLRANDELALIAKTMTPYSAEKLQFPLKEYWTQFCPLLDEFILRINQRRTHNLEGWYDLGFLTDQYRFHRGSEEWITQQQYLELPDSTRRMLAEAVRSDSALHRPSKLSPYDVFAMKRGGAHRAPIALIAEILYADLAVERKCRNSYFEFHDQEISPEILRYESRVTTVDGREEELADDIYEVIVNPFQPDLLWVYRGKRGRGAFLGTARAAAKSSRKDREQELNNLAREQMRLADISKEGKALHADIARDEARRLKHNNDVATGPRSAEEARVIEVLGAEELSEEDRAALAPTLDLPPEPAPASDLSAKDFI